jgi:uncharacterized protein with ParB-like and HNH nuclease domain
MSERKLFYSREASLASSMRLDKTERCRRMSAEQNPIRSIDGKGKTIKEMLFARKFYIDYYQREFKWQTKHVEELINDLTGIFINDYSSGHDREEVARYAHYFLGSIIISSKRGKDHIIDGQQRLTTLSLLIMWLLHRLRKQGEDDSLAQLVYSKKHGKVSFNLDVEERRAVMESIYNNTPMDDDDDLDESCQNMLDRYRDIGDLFPDELQTEALPYFADWLIENVHVVEITAYSDDVAYTIFETMNDRGLSLSPADMLKGYLLSKVTSEVDRVAATEEWKRLITTLRSHASEANNKEADADFFKAWLRSQYADSIRERKKNASPGEWDRIGTEFHRWLRDKSTAIGLSTAKTFKALICEKMAFYVKWYLEIRRAEIATVEGLENIYHNASHQFTHQPTMLLAAIVPSDSEATIRLKFRLVAKYIDIFLIRRLCNSTRIDYNTLQYNVFTVVRDIRGRTPSKIAAVLKKRLDAQDESLDGFLTFHRNQWSHKPIKRMLARFIDYVEVGSGGSPRYQELIESRGKRGYEVEHIWADKYARHKDEFSHPTEFEEYRDRLGDLLLLPKTFNASYGAGTYIEKRKHYVEHDILAKSLHPQAYEHNPGFTRFVKASGLPFHAMDDFKKAQIDERQALYAQIAGRIWDPEWLDRIADGDAIIA